MSEFERQLPRYRLVQTHHGDDLQAVAAREMGDANRWAELVWINNLSWPYLTDDPQRVVAGVLLSGSLLKVPSPAGFTEDKGDVYESDCVLRNKLLDADESGDFAIASGVDNLTQQLRHAVVTPRGQARRHPGYGCLVWRLLGTVNGPPAGLMGAEYVKETLLSDYRVTSVTNAIAEIDADGLRISAEANALAGGAVQVSSEATS